MNITNCRNSGALLAIIIQCNEFHFAADVHCLSKERSLKGEYKNKYFYRKIVID